MYLVQSNVLFRLKIKFLSTTQNRSSIGIKEYFMHNTIKTELEREKERKREREREKERKSKN
jgi:hypothetical protein